MDHDASKIAKPVVFEAHIQTHRPTLRLDWHSLPSLCPTTLSEALMQTRYCPFSYIGLPSGLLEHQVTISISQRSRHYQSLAYFSKLSLLG